MKSIYTLDDLENIDIAISSPCIVFLYWDLWAGKTTLSQILLRKYAKIEGNISSPTYVYYNKYDKNYHFDLYRLQSYDEFISIWWEEILDNNEGIILLEWPELLEKYYTPDITIHLEKTQDDLNRSVEISY